MNSIPRIWRVQAACALRAQGLVPQFYFPELEDEEDDSELSSLEELYLSGRSQEHRRQQGQYHTPAWLVDMVLDWLKWPTTTGFLDPACGTGAFLVRAARRLADVSLAQGLSAEDALSRVQHRISGCDSDPLALFICSINLHCTLSDLLLLSPASRPVWQLELGDFLQRGRKSHDAPDIVGNPPWGAKVLPAIRCGYTTRGESAFMFLEAALRMLKAGRRCVLILPDTVLLKHYPGIRKLVLEHSCLLRIGLLGKVFPGANVPAVVLDLLHRGTEDSANHYVGIWKRMPRGQMRELPAVEQRVFQHLPDHRFNVLMSPQGVEFAEQLSAGKVPLSATYRVHEGIHSGNVRHKLFVPNNPGEHGRKLILNGREVTPFRCRWGNHYIDNDPQLVDRQKGEYAALGRAADLGSSKVLIRRTGDHLIAAFDAEGLFISNNLFYCVPRSALSLNPKVLVCLLNSRLLNHLYQLHNPVMGRMFAELKIMHLSALPLPRADCPRLRQVEGRLLTLHDQAVDHGLDEQLQQHLDGLVRELYDCNEEQAEQLARHVRQLRPQAGN